MSRLSAYASTQPHAYTYGGAAHLEVGSLPVTVSSAGPTLVLHCYLCLPHCSPGNVLNPTPGPLMSTLYISSSSSIFNYYGIEYKRPPSPSVTITFICILLFNSSYPPPPPPSVIILVFCMALFNRNTMHLQEMVFQPTTPDMQQQMRDASLANFAELELNYKVLLYGIKVSQTEAYGQ